MRLCRSVSVVIAIAALPSALGCSRLATVDLAVVEPCGQENQALNGISSFRVVSSGDDSGGAVVAFPANAPQSLAVGLGDKVIISVEAYAEDITVGEDPNAPSVAPQAVGRTMPLTITETTSDVKGTLLVGKVDSFGAPRDLEGNCSAMTEGAPVAGRHGHTVTYMPVVNKVLIFGGAVWTDDNGTPVESILKTAEVFDPVTGTFTALPPPANARAYHTATALPDGRVVIIGGFSVLNGVTAPLINGVVVDVRADNPYTQTIVMRAPRAHHTATLLPDVGLIGIIGGCTGSLADGCGPDRAAAGSTNVVPSIEVLDVNDLGQSQAATGSLAVPRAMHQAVAFPSGNTGLIVVAGGINDTGALRGVEFLQVSGGSLANVYSDPAVLPEAVVRHQMTVFNSDQFVITGGQTQATGGVLNPAAPATAAMTICSKTDGQATCAVGTPLSTPRYGHAMARLQAGTLVVIGGVTAPGTATAEALRIVPGTGEAAWTPTAGALAVPRDRAAFTLLGGDTAADGFVNQIFYSGGHSTTPPFVTSSATDIYFGP